jgi:hypothetical protein
MLLTKKMMITLLQQLQLPSLLDYLVVLVTHNLSQQSKWHNYNKKAFALSFRKTKAIAKTKTKVTITSACSRGSSTSSRLPIGLFVLELVMLLTKKMMIALLHQLQLPSLIDYLVVLPTMTLLLPQLLKDISSIKR